MSHEKNAVELSLINSPPLITVPSRLEDENKELRVWEFCTAIHIAAVGTGTIVGREGDYDFGGPNMTRSATLTFVSFAKRYFAITCRHVLTSLEYANEQWRARFEGDTESVTTGVDMYHFFTPRDSNSIHFKFKLWGVPETSSGLPDVAIAEVTLDYIKSLKRCPLKITERLGLPKSAIAVGYPEQQRKLTPVDDFSEVLSTRVAHCMASLTVQSNRLVLSDSIVEHNGLDNLSGMSGGPIIWSDAKGFGLLGIVTDGLDVIPKESEVEGFGIAVFGEPISYKQFASWVSMMPPTQVLEDKSLFLLKPTKANQLMDIA